jgi:hypothetical protein
MEKDRAENIYERKSFTFDLSSSSEAAKLIIRSNAPSQQLSVENYVIEIDDQKPLIVFKHSEVHIKLNPGKHHLKIGAKGFGISSTADFSVEPNATAAFDYTGPYWIYSWGDLKKLD